jgi:hypothetical protein
MLAPRTFIRDRQVPSRPRSGRGLRINLAGIAGHETMRFLVQALPLALSCWTFGRPSHAEWRQFLVDPPDVRFEVVALDGGLGYTVVETGEGIAAVTAEVVAGLLFSTSADVEAEETTIRRHVWFPEPDAPTALFSWSGRAQVTGTFVIVAPPGSSQGNAESISKCQGFGMSTVSAEGGSTSVSSSGGGVSVTVPGQGGGSITLPSAIGGGRGFRRTQTTDGASQCVLQATVEKTKYAFVASWADSTWIPPRVGYARGNVRAVAEAEEHDGARMSVPS